MSRIMSGRRGENTKAIQERWPFKTKTIKTSGCDIHVADINYNFAEIIPLVDGSTRDEYLQRQFERA